MGWRSKTMVALWVAAMATLFIGTPSAWAWTATQEPLTSRMMWNHFYTSYWATPAASALEALPDGSLQRVEYDRLGDDPQLYVETYGPDLEFESGFAIPAEELFDTLAGARNFDPAEVRWGGVYLGTSYNYTVTGYSNEGESDSAPVIQVTQFTKQWERSAVQTIRGANTTVPFDAGSCRFAEDGNTLVMRTCHEMYASWDGANHQANMTFVFTQTPFTLVEQSEGVSSAGTDFGYVSHSFNQYVINHKGQFYTLDHGDAYPRAVVVQQLGTGSSRNLLTIPGETGRNYTGVTVDGFTSSERADTLLAVGTSVDLHNFEDSKTQNVWLSVADSDLSGSKLVNLTHYSEGGEYTSDGAQIAKVDDNRFLVLWQQVPTGSYDEGDELSTFNHWAPTLQYVFVDGNGNLLGDVETVRGMFSDNGPVLSNGKLVWYSTGHYGHQRMLETYISVWDVATAPVFQSIDVATGSYSCSNPLQFAFVEPDGEATYTGSPIVPKLKVYDGATLLEEGVDYTVDAANNVEAGEGTYILAGTGAYGGKVTGTFSISRAPIDSCDIAFDYEVPYTGDPVFPELQITFNGTPLVEGVDYTIDGEPRADIGYHGFTIEGTGNFTGRVDKSYHVLDVSEYMIYRIYNPYTGDHLYVKENEAKACEALGWRIESSNRSAVGTATPVYRLYNQWSHEHHYTSDANEYADLQSRGWTGEGVQFNSDDAGTVKVHRLWNGYAGIGNHVYTTSDNEYQTLLAAGWHDEGTAWSYAA